MPNETKYCTNCGEQIDAKAEICPKCGVRQPKMGSDEKSRIAAALFAIFLGGIGIHKFYLGDTKMGLVYLIATSLLWFFFWFTLILPFVPGIIAFIEGIIYLTMSDEAFREKYG